MCFGWGFGFNSTHAASLANSAETEAAAAGRLSSAAGTAGRTGDAVVTVVGDLPKPLPPGFVGPPAPVTPATTGPVAVKVVSRATPSLRNQSVPAIYDSSTGKLYIGSSAESHEAAVKLSRLESNDPTLRGLSIMADESGNLRVLNGGSLSVPRYITNPEEIAAVRAAIEKQFGSRIVDWKDLPPPAWMGLK